MTIIYPIRQWLKELSLPGGIFMTVNWKKDVFTIPNILSLLRLVMIPVYMTIYLRADSTGDYILAGCILALSCLTDLADGKIARHFHMISTLGKILDPIADKATQFTLTLCLALRYPILWSVMAVFVVKELFQLIAGVIHLRKGKILPGALMEGKICTTVFFISLIALVLMPQISTTAVAVIALVNVVFLVISFAGYIRAYYGSRVELEDMKK